MRHFVWALCAALVVLALFTGTAAADVYSLLYGSQVRLASYVGYHDGYVSAEGLGKPTSGTAKVRVISKNASLWSEPRTNSQRLASVAHGEEMDMTLVEGVFAQEKDGFYAVRYKGNSGWVNQAYVVFNPLEIVLMESNVPAYCAPSAQAKKVGSLSKLTRYTVLGFYGDYYVISLREAAAYIPMSVAHYDSTFEVLHSTGYSASGVTTRKTTLRTGPGKQYAAVQELAADYPITVYDWIDGWYLMINHGNSDDTYMYVSAEDVRITGETQKCLL